MIVGVAARPCPAEDTRDAGDVKYYIPRREIMEIMKFAIPTGGGGGNAPFQSVMTCNGVTWENDRFQYSIFERSRDPPLLKRLITEARSAARIYYLGKRSFITPTHPAVLASLNHCFNGITVCTKISV